MRLLLTSGGLRNETLKNAFFELASKPVSEIKVAFIPTALNVEPRDKTWVIDQLVRLKEMNLGQIDIVDISAIPREIWLPRLEESNVIFVNGGNTTYLMKSFNDSGLTKEIPRLLENRVYVGVSAGSYIATPDIRFNTDDVKEVLDGLKLVDFGLQVHLHSSKHPERYGEQAIRQRARGCPYTVYVLDDEMAIKIDDDNMQIIGEGEYLKIDS